METKMLRMEFYELPDCMKMGMEGRFMRDFAEHARTLIGHSKVPSKHLAILKQEAGQWKKGICWAGSGRAARLRRYCRG